MDNRKQESFDQRFLVPLKNRPGLEPDEAFVKKLREELMEGSNKIKYKNKSSWNWPILLTMAMAVMLFSIIAGSYIGPNVNLDKTKSYDSAEVTLPDKDKKNDQDLYELTAKNKAYDVIYKEVTKVTGSAAAGRGLVYYFDALEKKNTEYIKEVIHFEYYDQPIKEVIDYYKNADFTTLELENMYPDEQDAFNVIYSYTNSETDKKVRRRLLISLFDTKQIKIIDAATPPDINFTKDGLVKEKVSYLENYFRTGMTEKEAQDVFGKEFKEYENSDAEDGTAKFWSYEFFKEPGTVRQVEDDYMVDFANLANQNIGILFTIGWSPKHEAMKMTMFYTQNGKFHFKSLLPDGTQEYEEQKAGVIIYGKSEFQLTDEEKAAYNWFKLDHNRDNLKNLSPLSVAKLYIQAGFDGDAETEYALYTSRPDRVMWSKEEHLKYKENENTTKEQKLKIFEGIQDGEFIESSDFEGTITYENENGSHIFHMIKDPDGIWKVAFMPIQ